MSITIVQKASAHSSAPISASETLDAVFASPVSKDNYIVVFAATVFRGGDAVLFDTITDTVNSSYSMVTGAYAQWPDNGIDGDNVATFIETNASIAKVPANGSNTVSVPFPQTNFQVPALNHAVAYEIAIDPGMTLTTIGYGSTGGHTAAPDTGVLATSNGDLVLLDFLVADTNTSFHSGSGYTDDGFQTESFSITGGTIFVLNIPGHVVATGSSVEPNIVNPPTGNSLIGWSVSSVVLHEAAAGGGSSSTFLGSVRVVGSAPAGRSNPFLGTVKVIDSAPAGDANPYLGQVVEVGSAPAGDTNPSLGQVVVVDAAPAGDTDPYLGSVTTA